MSKKKHFLRFIVVSAGIVALILAAAWYWQSQPGTGYTVELGFAPLEHALHDRHSGFMSEVSGTVVRVVVDDKSEPRVQKFYVRLENGQTVMVIHDQQAAGRVPVSVNDQVTVRGEYTWSETGGTLHKTHKDLSPKRRHGFVEHEGERYQ